MGDYRKLRVWKDAMDLSVAIHRATRHFPAEARWGLAEQLRRASVSVTANLAEGAGRNGNREFRRFAEIALGSAAEVECCLELARRLGYLNLQELPGLLDRSDHVRRMLALLVKRLRSADSG